MEGTPMTPAGWYPDPEVPGRMRYWDGDTWTESVAPAAPVTPATPYPAAQYAPIPQPGGGQAVAGLVLGIIGMLAWFIPLFGLPITITGLVLSIKGRRSPKATMATVGLVLCIIGLLLTIANGAFGAYLGATGQLDWLQG